MQRIWYPARDPIVLTAEGQSTDLDVAGLDGWVIAVQVALNGRIEIAYRFYSYSDTTSGPVHLVTVKQGTTGTIATLGGGGGIVRVSADGTLRYYFLRSELDPANVRVVDYAKIFRMLWVNEEGAPNAVVIVTMESSFTDL